MTNNDLVKLRNTLINYWDRVKISWRVLYSIIMHVAQITCLLFYRLSKMEFIINFFLYYNIPCKINYLLNTTNNNLLYIQSICIEIPMKRNLSGICPHYPDNIWISLRNFHISLYYPDVRKLLYFGTFYPDIFAANSRYFFL